MIEEINPTKYYSSRQVIAMQVLPWSSAMTFNKKLREEKWALIFKPIVEHHSKFVRIYIKGSSINHYLELAANGKLNV
jgi:hypothetical protein